MDEFAEAHCKEIHVREWFAGIVPGAGVGTGYSMRALDAAAAAADGECFATDSLTEDYEFSFRIYKLGLKQTFVPKSGSWLGCPLCDAGWDNRGLRFRRG
jgi:adsorption protein B